MHLRLSVPRNGNRVLQACLTLRGLNVDGIMGSKTRMVDFRRECDDLRYETRGPEEVQMGSWQCLEVIILC